MIAENIYKYISIYKKKYHYRSIDDDMTQELAIHILEKSSLYNPALSSEITWTFNVITNYLIDAYRSSQSEDNTQTIPLSYFEEETDSGRVYSTLDAIMADIEEEDLLEENLRALLKEDYDWAINYATQLHNKNRCYSSTTRGKFKRIKERILNKKEKKKRKKEYNLTNVSTGMVTTHNSLNEVAKYLGCTNQLVSYAYKSGGLFLNKNYRIS